MECTVAALIENKTRVHVTKEGLEGANRKNPDRPVSLMTLAARQSVDLARQRGLCYERFTADITLDCMQLPPTGTRLQCGDLVLGILPERKKCWPECILLPNKLPCPLKEGVRFARVEYPGTLHLNDRFEII